MSEIKIELAGTPYSREQVEHWLDAMADTVAGVVRATAARGPRVPFSPRKISREFKPTARRGGKRR